MFGELRVAARAVSLCKACDTATGGHCQAGPSRRVFVGRNTPKTASQRSSSAGKERHNAVLCFCGELGGTEGHFHWARAFERRGCTALKVSAARQA